MSDTKLLSAAFSLLEQAVVLAKKERIAYMNNPAISLAGRDLTGKPLSLLIPSHITNTQADCFVSTAFIGTKPCTVKVTGYDGMRIFAITPDDDVKFGNEAMCANIRSSLANIKFAASCISVIGENEENKKLIEYVCALNRSYYRIKRSIDNACLLTSFANGTQPFMPEQLDITAVCKSVIDEVKEVAGKDGLSISFHGEEKIRMVADRALICQLLLNLLSNSIAHCPKNGRISVALLRTDKNVILSVDDNGEGISPDEISKSLERYKHKVSLTNAQGSGMGLAVVRAIAQLHGGAVIIESRGEGKGTSVRVMLSLDIPVPQSLNAVHTLSETDYLRMILTELSDCLPAKCFSEILED